MNDLGVILLLDVQTNVEMERGFCLDYYHL
jgi:hypothetical protein